VTLNALTIERVFCLAQDHRVDHFMTGDLRRQKRCPTWKPQVGEFHEPAADHLQPFLLHVLALGELQFECSILGLKFDNSLGRLLPQVGGFVRDGDFAGPLDLRDAPVKRGD
jgi:hypothetical protein